MMERPKAAPVVTLLLAIIFVREKVSTVSVLGVICIVIGVILVAWKN